MVVTFDDEHYPKSLLIKILKLISKYDNKVTKSINHLTAIELLDIVLNYFQMTFFEFKYRQHKDSDLARRLFCYFYYSYCSERMEIIARDCLNTTRVMVIYYKNRLAELTYLSEIRFHITQFEDEIKI